MDALNVLQGAGLAGAPLPTIAFSFMGPSHGWNVQEAANIAMLAIRDSFWTQPIGGAYGYHGGNSFLRVLANRAAFTEISICGTFEKALRERTFIQPNPKYTHHRQALQAAFK